MYKAMPEAEFSQSAKAVSPAYLHHQSTPKTLLPVGRIFGIFKIDFLGHFGPKNLNEQFLEA